LIGLGRLRTESIKTFDGPPVIISCRIEPRGLLQIQGDLQVAKGGQVAAVAGLSASGSLTVRKGGVVEIAGAPSRVEQDLANQGEIVVSGCNLDINRALQLEGELRLMNASCMCSNLAYAGTITLEGSWIQSRGPLDAQGSCYLNFASGSNSIEWANALAKPWPESAQVVISGWNEKNKIRAGQDERALSEAQLDRFAFTSVRGEDRNAKLIAGGWMVPVMDKPLGPPFAIVCQTEQQNVAFGGHIVLAANTLKPESATYQWLKDGAIIPGATDSVYHTRVATGAEGGFYTCVATAEGTTVESKPVLVTVEPRVDSQPVSVRLPGGTNLQLSVQVSGTAPMEYRWIHNGEIIQEAKGSRLSVTNLKPKDAGVYGVIVSNRAGVAKKQVARVELLPQFEEKPRDVSANQGEVITLTSKIIAPSSEGALKVRWYCNGSSYPAESIRTSNDGTTTTVISSFKFKGSSKPTTVSIYVSNPLGGASAAAVVSPKQP
jgi:hypothetical protein